MTTRLRRPAGVLLACALTAGVLGVSPLAHAAAGGTITGTVTGPDGLPLAGVAVDAFAFDGYWRWGLDGGHTQTDINGDYTLTLPAGEYRVGFRDSGNHVEEYYEDAATVEEGTTIELAEAEVEPVDAELALASHVTGVVTGADGLPLPEVYVDAYREVTEDGYTSFEYAGSGGYTDEDGRYDVGGLTPGDYRIAFKAYDDVHAYEFYDDQASVEAAEDITVGLVTTVEEVDAQLELASRVSGRVTDAAGDPLAGAMVYATVQAGTRWVYATRATTDGEGHYTLDSLPKGTYRIEFEAEVGEDWAYEYWENTGDFDEATNVVVGTDADIIGKDAQLVVGEHAEKFVVTYTEPTISGTPQVGQTLTAVSGPWFPTGATVAYQWYRGEELVAGATAPTYTLTDRDAGHSMWVEVIASYPGYGSWYDWASTTAVAAAPAPVATPVPPAATPAPTPTTPPAPVIAFSKAMDVTGALKVGSTLKLKKFKASVSTSAPATYTFQWFQGKKKIKKATKSKLRLTKALKGKKISVKVTAKVGSTTKTAKVKVGKVR